MNHQIKLSNLKQTKRKSSTLTSQEFRFNSTLQFIRVLSDKTQKARKLFTQKKLKFSHFRTEKVSK